MYVTARESFGLLTVRKVGECKKDCGQGEFPRLRSFFHFDVYGAMCHKNSVYSKNLWTLWKQILHIKSICINLRDAAFYRCSIQIESLGKSDYKFCSTFSASFFTITS